jgi:AraC family transcriptional regulator
MAETPVPVSMGSPAFVARETAGVLITSAWFPAGASLPAHVHDRPTFAVILDGGFELGFTAPGIRRRWLECPAGTVFTEPAGERHTNLVGRCGARALVLQPDPARDDLPRRTRDVLEGISHFRHGEMALAARRLGREVEVWDDVAPLAAAGLALEMLALAGRVPGRTAFAEGGAGAPWLRRVEEYLHAHVCDRLSLAELVAVAGEPAGAVAAAFRRAYGLPVGSYVRRLRLEWVADRLVRTTVPIAQLALQAGFADQPHLTRAFKRHTGLAPAAYRRHRAGAQGRARNRLDGDVQ